MRETAAEVPLDEWVKWILDGIKKIRAQKQRPSVQRICQAISTNSKYKFHENIVAEKLEQAVESGAILKVYNKGLHSYKAPSSGKRRCTYVNADTNLADLVTKAVRELGEYDGSSVKNIENYVQQSNNLVLADDADYKIVIKNSLKSAVEQGLLMLEGKLYKVGCVPLTPKKRFSGSPRRKRRTGDAAAATTSNTDGNNKSNEATPKAGINAVCFECSGTESKGPKGSAEPLTSCTGCKKLIHSTCANVTCNTKVHIDLTLLTSKGNKWFCEDCRACDDCNDTKGGLCLQCVNCSKMFHLNCLDPVPEKKSKKSWK